MINCDYSTSSTGTPAPRAYERNSANDRAEATAGSWSSVVSVLFSNVVAEKTNHEQDLRKARLSPHCLSVHNTKGSLRLSRHRVVAPALDGHRVQEAITMVRILYPRTLLMWVRQPVYYTFITPGSVSPCTQYVSTVHVFYKSCWIWITFSSGIRLKLPRNFSPVPVMHRNVLVPWLGRYGRTHQGWPKRRIVIV